VSLNDLDARTRANMEVALQRACEFLDSERSEEHTAREQVARGILRAVHLGERTLTELTRAGRAAALQARSRENGERVRR
jgi:hypothetical protein